MTEKPVKLRYDPDADILEVIWDMTGGYFTGTRDRRVLEKVDDYGSSLGFQMTGLRAMKGASPFTIDLGGGPRAVQQWVTTERAASELGVSRPRVRQLLRTGRIRGAEMVGRDWSIPLPVKVLAAPGRRSGNARDVNGDGSDEVTLVDLLRDLGFGEAVVKDTRGHLQRRARRRLRRRFGPVGQGHLWTWRAGDAALREARDVLAGL